MLFAFNWVLINAFSCNVIHIQCDYEAHSQPLLWGRPCICILPDASDDKNEDLLLVVQNRILVFKFAMALRTSSKVLRPVSIVLKPKTLDPMRLYRPNRMSATVPGSSHGSSFYTDEGHFSGNYSKLTGSARSSRIRRLDIWPWTMTILKGSQRCDFGALSIVAQLDRLTTTNEEIFSAYPTPSAVPHSGSQEWSLATLLWWSLLRWCSAVTNIHGWHSCSRMLLMYHHIPPHANFDRAVVWLT